MRIRVITFAYNEEFLLPFFLSHYHWADDIYVAFSASTDRSYDILKAARNVSIDHFEMPDGIDDVMKMDKLNWCMRELGGDTDWFILADVDEFLWPPGDFECRTAKTILSSVPGDRDYLMGRMWNVYRHHTDSDLDPSKAPVVLQRRHGDPDRDPRSPNPEGAQGYQKPVIIRSRCGIQIGTGCHDMYDRHKHKAADESFDGAHWAYADPAFGITRMVRDRRDHMSRANMSRGMGAHHYDKTSEKIIDRCNRSANFPQVF